MKSATSCVGASSTRCPAAVSTMTSVKAPYGDSAQRPTTTRTPLVVPTPAIAPRNRSTPEDAPPSRRRHRIGAPEIDRAITSRWISEVPSKIV